MKFDRQEAGNDPLPGQAEVASRDIAHSETMPVGSQSAGATAADPSGPVEQRPTPDGGSMHRHAENSRFQALKAAIQEGVDSGVSDKTIPLIMEEVEARLRGEDRL